MLLQIMGSGIADDCSLSLYCAMHGCLGSMSIASSMALFHPVCHVLPCHSQDGTMPWGTAGLYHNVNLPFPCNSDQRISYYSICHGSDLCAELILPGHTCLVPSPDSGHETITRAGITCDRIS